MKFSLIVFCFFAFFAVSVAAAAPSWTDVVPTQYHPPIPPGVTPKCQESYTPAGTWKRYNYGCQYKTGVANDSCAWIYSIDCSGSMAGEQCPWTYKINCTQTGIQKCAWDYEMNCPKNYITCPFSYKINCN